MSLFEPELEYQVAACEADGTHVLTEERGYQIGVLAIRDARDVTVQSYGKLTPFSGFGLDHWPSKLPLVHVRKHCTAVFLADTLSLTAPEDEDQHAVVRWVQPYVAWVQAVARAEHLDLPLPSYRDFVAEQERAA